MQTQEIEAAITEAEAAQDAAQLNEGDLTEVAGGMSYSKNATGPKPAAVDYF